MFKQHRGLKITILALVVLVVAAATNFITASHLLLRFDPNKVPPITASPVDINKIFAISYFRSEAGHDYSSYAWDGETCRSMKHYFNFDQNMVNGNLVRSQSSPGHPDITIRAPFDGEIIAVDSERDGIGKQIHIRSAKTQLTMFVYFT